MAFSNDESILALISDITEFNDLSDFMEDKQLDFALASVIKLIMKPDVPQVNAHRLIVELQGLSAKFSVLASIYTTIKRDKAGTVNNNKKNLYYTLSNALDRLVDALKYTARYGT